MRREYQVPMLTRVELRAEEAVLTGCKDSSSLFSGAPQLPVGTLGCQPPGTVACREVGS